MKKDKTIVKKDALGIYIVGNESAKFWLFILNDLKNIRVKDILIASVGRLTGFSEAIKIVFPYTDIQRYIIHQIRYTLSFVSYKAKKEFTKD